MLIGNVIIHVNYAPRRDLSLALPKIYKVILKNVIAMCRVLTINSNLNHIRTQKATKVKFTKRPIVNFVVKAK